MKRRICSQLFDIIQEEAKSPGNLRERRQLQAWEFGQRNHQLRTRCQPRHHHLIRSCDPLLQTGSGKTKTNYLIAKDLEFNNAKYAVLCSLQCITRHLFWMDATLFKHFEIQYTPLSPQFWGGSWSIILVTLSVATAVNWDNWDKSPFQEFQKSSEKSSSLTKGALLVFTMWYTSHSSRYSWKKKF